MLDELTEGDVKDFKRAFTARFSPDYGVELSEDTVQEDTNNLAEGIKESLLDYYGRAQHLLRRSHAKDTPIAVGEQLTPIERMVVNRVIKVFVSGIKDDSIKKAILMRNEKLPASLLEAYEVTLQTMGRLEQVKEFEKLEYEKLEVEFLRRDFASRHERPLMSVLADTGNGNKEIQANFRSFEQSRLNTQRRQNSYCQPTMSLERRAERNTGTRD
ncbi:hypothetical protein GcC1_177023 [Golovinomyces cichoracearum]|uniref:Uncharacterized protein n=1 Tax=Golovinomyces cichoracearum TaxID=62708 RepID=A0A420HNX7_9PEZI|nr:hypothetical protein GcC1_177023 [Golovinomyces cichoracearum]